LKNKKNPKTLNTTITRISSIMVEPTLFPRQPPQPEEHIRKQGADTAWISRLSKKINALAVSLKILEERYSTLKERTQVSEQNMIEMEKELRGDIKMLSEDVMDIKRELKDLNDKLRLISAEIKNLVNKNDFKVMERYVDMWQPMNFVTREELNKLLEEKKSLE